MATSAAAAALTGAAAESLLVSGSGSFDAVLVAVLVIIPGCVTRAVIVSVSLCPLMSGPTVQRPLPAVYEPCEGNADTNDSPAGSTSVMMTPVARFGPWFVAVMTIVTVSPTRALVGVTVLSSATSAFVLTGVSAVAVLLPGVGSVVLLATLAVWAIGFGVV